MTADINVILQLLQRQMAPVPPAYSAVSPAPLPPSPASLYAATVQPLQVRPSLSVVVGWSVIGRPRV